MASSQTLTDHRAIQDWAESRKAKPACVRDPAARMTSA